MNADEELRKKANLERKQFYLKTVGSLLFVGYVSLNITLFTTDSKGGYGLSQMMLTEYIHNKYSYAKRNSSELKWDLFGYVTAVSKSIASKDTLIKIINDYYGPYDYVKFREYIKKSGFEKQYVDAFKIKKKIEHKEDYYKIR